MSEEEGKVASDEANEIADGVAAPPAGVTESGNTAPGEDGTVLAEQPREEPLPEPFIRDDTGKPRPLPGVETLFLTGTTVEILGLSSLGKDGAGDAVAHISKEKLLGDIQFRGAISDFHALKSRIVDADYDPLVLKIIEDDVYGDGNNFEIALAKEAAARWVFVEEELVRRRQQAEEEAAQKAAEKALPRSKRKREVKPWQSLGSEVEIEEASTRPTREVVRIVVQRARKDFGQPFKFADKDAHELWNSSQMECRPFKDPNFDMRRMEQETGTQAVPVLVHAAVQATPGPARPNASQYEPQDLPTEKKARMQRSTELIDFLDRVQPRYEEALVQNEVANIFRDDFAALAEEDGMSGTRKDLIAEYQSFTDLIYSKTKVVSAIQWLTHRRGFVAVACTEPLSHAERVARMGRPNNSYILVWNFKDPIHPEYVLECPCEVFCFQFNTTNPEIITAGCYNGLVVMWDTSGEHERIQRIKNSKQEDGGDEAAIPVVKYKYQSAVEFSHHTVVTDLQWLSGIEVGREGRVTKLGERECVFFVTCAADGKVMFWDIRMERLMRKGRKLDEGDLVWKPSHVVPLISLQGMDLGCTKFTFKHGAVASSDFHIGSFDGEIVHAEFTKDDTDDNADFAKSCIMGHAGPVVAMQRSPFFEEVILSVGDWSFQIWHEGSPSPIFCSPYAAEYYTGGTWSPTRPAVVYITDQSGNLEIWDLLDRSHEPALKVTVSSTAITSMNFNPQNSSAAQQFLALGDCVGVLHIMELPRNLRRPVSNEKKLFGNFLERELARVKELDSRAPIRAKVLKEQEESRKAREDAEEAAKEAAREAASKGAQDRSEASEFDEKAEAEYRKLEERFKVQLGLVEAAAS